MPSTVDRFPRAIADRDFVYYREFETAEDFYAALQPLSGLWTPEPTEWLFRGKPCAWFDLLPSAHREESWVPFKESNEKTFAPKVAREFERQKHELELLRRFYRAADAAGLSVPGDTGNMRETLHHPDAQLKHYIPVLAYAQHYGLPTRLLDWTGLARVAAYFAALEPVREPKDKLAVVGVNGRFISKHGEHLENNERLLVARAPRASNPNLHAQSGLFTYAEIEKLAPLDHVVSRIATGDIKMRRGTLDLRGEKCLVERLVLPRTEAKKLMRLLHLDGISGNTLFPGPGGVVKSIIERYWSGAPDEAF